MATDHLLATLEQTLRQTRASRARLVARLAELEQEADALRAEIEEMDAVAAQTEETMYRFMSSVLGRKTAAPGRAFAPPPPVVPARAEPVGRPATVTVPAASLVETYSHPEEDILEAELSSAPVAAAEGAAVTVERFAERTIPQATAAILREAGGPLHVNDIYERLMAGGFVFSGHNPTISIAVSLNRNSRFRKVAPGTFDLVMREAATQVS